MLKALLTTILLVFYSLTTHAETSVWKVESGKETVYIAGTVHILRKTDFPLPAEFDIAYRNSDRIIFETDIAAISDASTQERMVALMTAEPGRTLDKLLHPDTWEVLTAAASKRGVDLKQLMQFKAGMIVTLLQISELMRLGMTLEGVDTYFNGRAIQDQMPIGELETIEEQLLFLSGMGEGKEEEYVRLSLRDLDNLQPLYEEMILSWRTGDMGQMEALFVYDMKRDFTDVYEQLLVQRNNNWLPKIEKMFQQPGTEYVLVGVGHLVGADGILQRLEKKGYSVTQIGAEPTR